MRVGILGLPKAGKTTLFNLLTASHQATDKFAASRQANLGVTQVPDRRLDRLQALFKPRKTTPASVEYVDVPGLRRGDGAEQFDLPALKGVDALMHVLRSFDDPEIPHAEGSLDPRRDAETVDLELILADLDIVERRLERLAKAAKGRLSDAESAERRLLTETIRPALEAERPLRDVELDAADELRLRGFQLLSAKPMLQVVNVADSAVADASPDDFGLRQTERCRAVVVSAPIEEEISRLPAAEQPEFLAAVGLSEPSLDRLIRASYELLGLISFFTVGEDEVRAWTIRRGTAARQAAGAIHSDMERGFIRAEVVPGEDLLRLGSLAACRDQGLLRLEGKGYVVQDGDVVHYRFNV